MKDVFHNLSYPKQHEVTLDVFHNLSYSKQHEVTLDVFHNLIYPKQHEVTLDVFHNLSYPKQHEVTLNVFHNLSYPKQHEVTFEIIFQPDTIFTYSCSMSFYSLYIVWSYHYKLLKCDHIMANIVMITITWGLIIQLRKLGGWKHGILLIFSLYTLVDIISIVKALCDSAWEKGPYRTPFSKSSYCYCNEEYRL